jgi:hypothetical protein
MRIRAGAGSSGSTPHLHHELSRCLTKYPGKIKMDMDRCLSDFTQERRTGNRPSARRLDSATKPEAGSGAGHRGDQVDARG